jgi:hypothetical protein
VPPPDRVRRRTGSPGRLGRRGPGGVIKPRPARVPPLRQVRGTPTRQGATAPASWASARSRAPRGTPGSGRHSPRRPLRSDDGHGGLTRTSNGGRRPDPLDESEPHGGLPLPLQTPFGRSPDKTPRGRNDPCDCALSSRCPASPPPTAGGPHGGRTGAA